MAKRKPEAKQETDIFAKMEDQPAGDPFFDLVETDDADAPKTKRERKRRPSPGGATYGAPPSALLPPPDRLRFGGILSSFVGGLIGFLLLGLIAAVALRFTGVIGTSAAAEATPEPDAPPSLSSAASLSGAAATDSPEIAAVPTDGPSPTPDPGCNLGIGWWQVEIQDDWDFFAGTARTEWLVSLGADQLRATLEALRLRRQALDSVYTPPCYIPARDYLLRGADGMINALGALIAGDAAGGRATADAASAELALVLVAVWEQGVVTAPDSPPALAIPRGGGDTCQPGDWFAQAEPNLIAFKAALDAFVTSGGAVLSQQLQIGTIDALVGNFGVLTPQGCALTLQTAAIGYITASAEGLRQFSSGQTSEGRALISGFWAQKTQFDAWMTWLGLRVV